MPWEEDGTRKKPGAYKMKYTKGGFPFKSPVPKIIPTPEIMQHLDDQIVKMNKLGNKGATQILLDKKSKLMDELAISKQKNQFRSTETDAEVERREDAMGVTSNIKTPKVFKDGKKNKSIYKGKIVD